MEPSSSPFEVADVLVTDYCQLRIPSLPERINLTIDWLVRRATQNGGVHPNRANRLTIALHEALTNSIIHGNLGISSDLKERGDSSFVEAVAARCADPVYAARTVDVGASYDGQATRWVISDQGEGFDVERVLHRLEHDEPDPLQPSGRGLFMIRAFVDEMRYEDRGRRLTLTIYRSDEKRAAPRYPFAQAVRIAPIVNGEVNWDASHEALARDISSHGIGFLQSRLAESPHVLITIPTPGEPVFVRAVVRHWQQVGDNVEVGCRFEGAGVVPAVGQETPREAGAAALVGLVDRLSQQQNPREERRSAPRLPYTKAIQIQMADHAPLRGFGRDISQSGIAFFTTSSLPLEVVRVSLPGDETIPPIHARARVVRCTRLTDGFYDVAAQFLVG
jgi:anti-sigma regulatory factor (Ser/Thr protein kinase)